MNYFTAFHKTRKTTQLLTQMLATQLPATEVVIEAEGQL